MKKYLIILFLLMLSIHCTQVSVFANENTEQQETRTIHYSYNDNKTAILDNYNNVLQDDWEKYFSKQTKQLKKIWKKEIILKDAKYKTSYARILFFVNKKGEILSYQIKSSCIPKDDIKFMESIDNAIKKMKNFSALPSNYNNDLIVFTVKFNSFIPKRYQNAKYIEWDRYGIADIEISQNKSYFILEK